MKYSTLSFALLLIGSIEAQITETRDVYTGFEPRLAEVDKFQDNPAIKDTFPVIKDTLYFFKNEDLSGIFKPDTITALKLKGEPLKRLHRLFTSAAFGNYTTMLGDIQFHSLRDKNHHYYINLHHFSSNGTISERGNPQLSDNSATGGYSYRFKPVSIGVDAAAERNQVHYYGYNPALDTLIIPDSTRQRYTHYNANLWAKSHHRTDSIRFNFNAEAGFYHLADLYGTMENRFRFKGNLNKFTDFFAHEFIGTNLQFDYFTFAQNGNISHPGAFISSVNPYFEIGDAIWKLHFGIGITVAGGDSSFFGVFPKLKGHLNIFRKYIILFAGLDGNYERQTFDLLRRNNPFLLSNLQLANRHSPWLIDAGIKGAFSDHISYQIGVGYTVENQTAFFIPDSLGSITPGFLTVYDRLNTFNLSGNLHYQYGDKFSLNLKSRYSIFDTRDQAAAWYRPQFETTLNARYNLGNKITATADIYFIGTQIAPKRMEDLNGNSFLATYTLNPLFDMNLSGTYRLNRNFSFFLKLNNLAAFRYNRYYEYPTFGFNLMGGVSIGI